MSWNALTGRSTKVKRRILPFAWNNIKNGEVSWTAKHLPVRPLHWELVRTREEAVEREKYLKGGKGREWLKAEYESRRLKCFERQAGAWIDAGKCDERDGQIGVVGYEIPFNRHFYQYEPPRDLKEIDADLDVLSAEIMEMLREVHS